MKKLFILICILALATTAFAAVTGKLVVDPNNRALPYHSPAASSAACATVTTNKGTIATVTTAGYSTLCWEASDSSNAAKRIKRHLNSNTDYLPATGGCIGLNNTIASVVFKPYSGAWSAYTVCYDLQSGGKTP
jgi:hypothetical protein